MSENDYSHRNYWPKLSVAIVCLILAYNMQNLFPTDLDKSEDSWETFTLCILKYLSSLWSSVLPTLIFHNAICWQIALRSSCEHTEWWIYLYIYIWLLACHSNIWALHFVLGYFFSCLTETSPVTSVFFGVQQWGCHGWI